MILIDIQIQMDVYAKSHDVFIQGGVVRVYPCFTQMTNSLVINLPVESLQANASQNLARLSKESGITIDVSSSKAFMSIFLRFHNKSQDELQLFRYQLYDRACKRVTKKFELEQEEVAKIIGKRGIRIKQLQQIFSLKLNIDKYNELTVSGHEQAIDDFLKEINHVENAKVVLDDNQMILYLLNSKFNSNNQFPTNVKSIGISPSFSFLISHFPKASASNENAIVFDGPVSVDIKSLISAVKSKYSSLAIPSFNLPSSVFAKIQSSLFIDHHAYLSLDGNVLALKDDLLPAMNHLLTIKQEYHVKTISISNPSLFKPWFNSALLQSKYKVDVYFEHDNVLLVSKQSIKLQSAIRSLGVLMPSPWFKKFQSSSDDLLLNKGIQYQGIQCALVAIHHEYFLIGISTDAPLNPILDLIVADIHRNTTNTHCELTSVPFPKSFIKELTAYLNKSFFNKLVTIGINTDNVTVLGPDTTKVVKDINAKLLQLQSDYDLNNFSTKLDVDYKLITKLRKMNLQGVTISNKSVVITGKESFVNAQEQKIKSMESAILNAVTKSCPLIHGHVIKQFQNKHGVTIHTVDNELQITGDLASVDACIQDVSNLIKFNKQHGASTTVPIPQGAISWIIGKNGQRIEKLKQLTLCKINMPKRGSEASEVEIVGKMHELGASVVHKLMDYYNNDNNQIVVDIQPGLISMNYMHELLNKYNKMTPIGKSEEMAMVIASMIMDKPWTQLQQVQFSQKQGKVHLYGINTAAMTKMEQEMKEYYKNMTVECLQIIGISLQITREIEEKHSVEINKIDRKQGPVTVVDEEGHKIVKIIGNKSNVEAAVEEIKNKRNQIIELTINKDYNSMVNRVTRQHDVYSNYKRDGEDDVWKIEGRGEILKEIKEVVGKMVISS